MKTMGHFLALLLSITLASNAIFAMEKPKALNDYSIDLWNAAARGDENEVQRLLQIPGINVNIQDRMGATPLYIAVQNEHIGVVVRLLQDPAINIFKERTIDGATPLHIAAYKGNTSLIRLLIENSADPTTKNSSGWVPTQLAKDLKTIRAIQRYANAPDCPICYKKMSIIYTPACNHTFHQECIERWKDMNLSCPICRKPL